MITTRQVTASEKANGVKPRATHKSHQLLGHNADEGDVNEAVNDGDDGDDESDGSRHVNDDEVTLTTRPG